MIGIFFFKKKKPFFVCVCVCCLEVENWEVFKILEKN